MPVPAALGPIAWKAAQMGAVAAVAWYAARRKRADGPREIWRERVLDEVGDRIETDYGREPGAARAGAAARLRRAIRLGADGPGVEFDLSALARLRVRRV